MNSQHERFVASQGISLWTTASGAGSPVLLANGGPGCCDYLAPVAELLADQARVIRFEARGCGRSTGAPPYSVATSLEDLELIRQHYGIERWIVAGHSWGADLALLYSLEYPAHVAGCICIAGGRIQNDREWHRIYSERSAQGLEPMIPFDYPINYAVNDQVNQSWKAYIQRPDLLKDLAQLDCPALFIYGKDDIRPSWPVEQVARLLPNSHLNLISGANHFIWQSHAAELKTWLGDFVSAHGRPA